MRKFTLDKEYITELLIEEELTLGEDMVLDTGEVFGLKGTSFFWREWHNHPRFSNFRYRLERMGYITVGNPDIALKDFAVNEFKFLVGEIFPTSEQLKNRHIF